MPVSGRPIVSAGNHQPKGIHNVQQRIRPASGRTPNRNQINQEKYKELLNQPDANKREFKPVFINESNRLAKLAEKDKNMGVQQSKPSAMVIRDKVISP